MAGMYGCGVPAKVYIERFIDEFAREIADTFVDHKEPQYEEVVTRLSEKVLAVVREIVPPGHLEK